MKRLTHEQIFERWWKRTGARHAWADAIAKEVAHGYARVAFYQGISLARRRVRIA